MWDNSRDLHVLTESGAGTTSADAAEPGKWA